MIISKAPTIEEIEAIFNFFKEDNCPENEKFVNDFFDAFDQVTVNAPRSFPELDDKVSISSMYFGLGIQAGLLIAEMRKQRGE